jgi:hypothetical protein
MLFPAQPIGEPHRFPYSSGNKFYSLVLDEFLPLEDWLWIYSHEETQIRMKDESSNLRKQIDVAMEFFSSSSSQKDEAQRLIHLMVALEALYSPSDQMELSYRIRQFASQAIGTTPEERRSINLFLKEIYGVRSKLVHGSLNIKDYYDDTLITSEQNAELSSIVRKGILRLFVLFLRGRNNLKESNKLDSIHLDLEQAMLDDSFGDRLRDLSDVDSYVKEFRERYTALSGSADN